MDQPQGVTITMTAIMPDGQALHAVVDVRAGIDPATMVRHGVVSAARTLEDAAQSWADSRATPRHTAEVREYSPEPLPQRTYTMPPPNAPSRDLFTAAVRVDPGAETHVFPAAAR
jgi:hypothetical protein